MKKMTLLSVLLVLGPSFAEKTIGSENSTYDYCEIYGIADGTDDSLTRTIAGRIMDKQGMWTDPVCQSIRRDSVQFARVFHEGKFNNPSDLNRWLKYQYFRDKIADKIIELLQR